MHTALIVEDDPDQAEIAAQMLRRREFETVIAEDGKTALRLARELNPDVVLLDIMLPDIDGFDLCKQFRCDCVTMTTPIVMLTALDGSGYERKGYRVGANAYLAKPYGAPELFSAIATARAWKARLERGEMRGEIQIELNSEANFLQDVNDFLVDLCRGTPLTCEQINQLRQAVLEMGLNAIEWGNRHEVEALVRITYRIHDDRVGVVIRDEGPGFDRSHLPHAASPEDPIAHLDVREKLGLREGGFGLLIARGMVDELSYNDRGNEVTLIKRFPPRKEEGTAAGSPRT